MAGHSFGSYLATRFAKQEPDKFHALVGISLLANDRSSEQLAYQWAIAEASKREAAAALRELAELGEPPYSEGQPGSVLWKWVRQFGGIMQGETSFFNRYTLRSAFAPEYTVKDWFNFFRGMSFSQEQLGNVCYQANLFDEAPSLELPVFILNGRHDRSTACEVAEDYYHQLEAPLKRFIAFENSAHSPHLEEEQEFTQVMVDVVLAETIAYSKTRP